MAWIASKLTIAALSFSCNAISLERLSDEQEVLYEYLHETGGDEEGSDF
jgi:hypothetical protein